MDASELIEAAILRPKKASVIISDMILKRKGDVIDREVAYERGRNIATALMGYTIESELDEQTRLLQILWKKLPSSIRSKVDLKKLSDFVGAMEAGDTLSHAARVSNLPTALAVDLLSAVEGAGLL